MISEIRFERASASTFIDVNLPNIQIHFATTTKQPDGLSSTFAENIGADDTVVYSGPLHFFDTGFESFGIHILLQQPFIYDRTQGNLLMDVRNFSTIPPPPFTQRYLVAENTLGDSVSTVGAPDVNSATGSLNTGGLVTLFAVTPVPEPSSSVLLLAGLAVLGWSARKRRGLGTNH